MKTINLITGERVSKILFPDGQPHVRIIGIEFLESVRVVCPLRSGLEIVQLLEVVNAIHHTGAVCCELVIPYLMGARYDRIIQAGDSFDLEVVANIINSCGFLAVNLFDVHSTLATRLIRNSRSHNNSRLVKSYVRENAVLICPDAGAREKIGNYQEWNPRITETVFCEKSRDPNGVVSLTVIEPGRCTGRNCVIIDDICDGGATFLAIAKQIQPENLTLIVSHGIFSKGFRELHEYFDEIITTDSFAHHAPDKVTTIPLNL